VDKMAEFYRKISKISSIKLHQPNKNQNLNKQLKDHSKNRKLSDKMPSIKNNPQ
jgi:hypothetical protein